MFPRLALLSGVCFFQTGNKGRRFAACLAVFHRFSPRYPRRISASRAKQIYVRGDDCYCTPGKTGQRQGDSSAAISRG